MQNTAHLALISRWEQRCASRSRAGHSIPGSATRSTVLLVSGAAATGITFPQCFCCARVLHGIAGQRQASPSGGMLDVRESGTLRLRAEAVFC